MDVKRNNQKIKYFLAIYDKVDEVIENIFESLVNRYLIGKKHQ